MSNDDWRYWELISRERRRAKFPSPERHRVKSALSRIEARYRQIVAFRNPLVNKIQLIDFCVWTPNGMVCIIFGKYPNHGLHEYQKESLRTKEEFFEQKGIPLYVANRGDTSQIHEINLRNLIKRRTK